MFRDKINIKKNKTTNNTILNYNKYYKNTQANINKKIIYKNIQILTQHSFERVAAVSG